MNLRNSKTIQERRELLEKELKISLSHTGSFSLDGEVASTRNCENMIGATQIPLGIAGPLKINNLPTKQWNDYYAPLATTEGALVASVSRGCKAITESGGAVVDVYRAGATRGPVFKVANLNESDRLNRFFVDHFEDLKRVAVQTSHHLSLKKYMDRGVGHYRFVRFVFDTQDAMGLNMVTIATQALIAYIQQKTGIMCISVAGNYDVDKKPSWLNSIEGRGTKVWAEVVLSKKILQHVLKTTAKQMFDVWLAKCMIGSAMSGSMGFNAQFANVLSALFIATGQDPAHVAECAIGMTTAEMNSKGDLYVSVYLPDLMVGTVGGGTGLGTQKEALEILGVAGPSADGNGKNAEKFAGIVGAAVLAGEISLLASLSQGTLASAHQKLARGEIVRKTQKTRSIRESENRKVGISENLTI